jgi:hypothetical protein
VKLTTITMALAFAAGALGLSATASAQDHRAPEDRSMRHDDQMRHNDMGHDRVSHIRRDVRHYERHDRQGWGHHRRHCRTEWRHHHRIRRCW